MTFLTAAALALALFVVAPVVAHLLRRRQAEERPFPPARLVPPTPPTARRRSLLEDRALFVLRVLSVLALAALGATPFVRCARLSLERKSGASVAIAIVLDDSLSMRAPLDGGTSRPGAQTRWERALTGARELGAGLRPGDAVAIVLAGAPARVALASTTDTGALLATLDGLQPGDRATDLDGAVQLARGLLQGLAQPDKRIVLLSDLADGSPDAPPLASQGDIALWAPLPELEARGEDCGITRADRTGGRVWVRVVCSPSADGADGGVGSASEGRGNGGTAARSVEVRAGDKLLKSAALPPHTRIEEVPIDLPGDAPEVLRAVLTGGDAIAEDDQAPILAAGGALPIAVVVDAAAAHVATGGAPPIEQAFAALQLDAQVRPLPTVPERQQDLAAFAALVVDDAPGFTPEVRRALGTWIEKGGVALFTLGPRAAAAPLGAGFDPLVPGVVRWGLSPVPGADPATAATLGTSAEGLAQLAPKGRATLDPEALAGADVIARWKDGAPLLLRRSIGRGAALVLTLPLSADESDLVLRPAFLALLDRFVGTARARGGARRVDAGETWTFDGYHAVKIERVSIAGPGKPEPIPVTEAPLAPGGAKKPGEVRLLATPARAGLYALTLDGEETTRVATIPEREIDLRPRKVETSARSAALGGVATSLDVSPYVALLLLALLAAELLLRALGIGRESPSRA
jgi:hypothetical protein